VKYILTVDFTNKSAWITDDTGRTISAWSGVTRGGAESKARAKGWKMVTRWELTSPPDGYWREVRKPWWRRISS
jgi:hypothetical protein